MPSFLVETEVLIQQYLPQNHFIEFNAKQLMQISLWKKWDGNL